MYQITGPQNTKSKHCQFLKKNYFIVFNYSCLHLPPATPLPYSRHSDLPPLLPPLLGFVHVSFIVVPGHPYPLLHIIPSHLPSGYGQIVLNFNKHCQN